MLTYCVLSGCAILYYMFDAELFLQPTLRTLQ